MVDLLIEPLLKYGTFTGRAARREFWAFACVFAAATVGAHYFDLRDGDIEPLAAGMGMVELIAFLALLLPFISIGARRLHDTGRSGWWMLFLYIPYLAFVAASGNDDLVIAASGGLLVGAAALMILFALPSTLGPNAFGPNPRKALPN